MKKNIFLSFVVCLLMMCAAALCVNKTLFGKDFSESGNVEVESDSAPAVVTSDGETVIHTSSLTDVPGYSGKVPLDIIVRDGRIAEIKALPNGETPHFFGRAETLFDKWRGKTPVEAAALKVDAMSGATYSSNAIIANVDAGLEEYMQTPSQGGGQTVPVKMWIALAVTLAACILPLIVSNKIYRFVQLVANVIVLGFWAGQFLDYSLMLRYLSDGISIPGGLVAVVMLIAAFIYPMFGKQQYYCNHICPLGSAQMLVAEICHYKIKISKKVLDGLDWFRKILWAVLMLMLWADIFTDWMDLELFQAFLVNSAPIGIMIAAILFVALSAVVSRPCCRFVCPTGSLFKRVDNIG